MIEQKSYTSLVDNWTLGVLMFILWVAWHTCFNDLIVNNAQIEWGTATLSWNAPGTEFKLLSITHSMIMATFQNQNCWKESWIVNTVSMIQSGTILASLVRWRSLFVEILIHNVHSKADHQISAEIGSSAAAKPWSFFGWPVGEWRDCKRCSVDWNNNKNAELQQRA